MRLGCRHGGFPRPREIGRLIGLCVPGDKVLLSKFEHRDMDDSGGLDAAEVTTALPTAVLCSEGDLSHI